MKRPEWADPNAAREALREAQSRQQRVEEQGKRVRGISFRSWRVGQENHFQKTVSTLFGVPR